MLGAVPVGEVRGRMRRVMLAEGVRWGLVLSCGVLLLGVLGTAPAFRVLPETPLLVLALALPVLGYGFVGVNGWRRATRIAAGVLAGAVAGAISGSSGGLSYLLLNQLFYDTVRTQPEKILNFRASGLPTMRDY